MSSPASGGRGSSPSVRDAGFRCHMTHQSVWGNAVVLLRKKDGGLCFCIDFCCLNAQTKKDSYPLPRIQEALESLVGAGHSCLDLKSGFWQIKMEQASKQYTAFMVGNLGFFECDHMPFELCNAPATFQWLIQNCLSKLNLFYCLIYLDDTAIFLQMAEEHLHQSCVVFNQLREYNLKVMPIKCSFLRRRSPTWHIRSLKKVCTQQLEFESKHRIFTAPNLHGGACLSWPCRPLLMVH